MQVVIFILLHRFYMSKNLLFAPNILFFAGNCLPAGRYFFCSTTENISAFFFLWFPLWNGHRARLLGRLHITPCKKTTPNAHKPTFVMVFAAWLHVRPPALSQQVHARRTPPDALPAASCSFLFVPAVAPGHQACCLCFVNLR